MMVIHEIAKGHLLVSIRVWLLLLELILYVVFRQTIERNISQTSILPKKITYHDIYACTCNFEVII